MDYEQVLKNIQVGQRYVFYQSALDSVVPEIRQAATDAVSALSSELTQNVQAQKNQTDSMSRIDIALNFLKGAAAAERTKELQFFKNFQSNYPETKDLFKDLNTIDIKNDYVEFIAKINKTLRGVTNFKRMVNDEIKRIERYNNSRQYTSKGKPKKWLTQQYENALTNNNTAYRAVDTVFTSDAKKRIEGLINNRTNEGKLTSLVLEAANKQLFSINSSHLQLNGSQLTILVNLLTDKLYNMIIQETGNFSKNTINDYGRKMAFDSEFQQYITNLLDAPNLSVSLTSIAEQFGLYDKNLKKIEADDETIKQVQNKLYNAYQAAGGTESQGAWLKKNKNKIDFAGMAKAATHVSVIGYYTGEDMSLDTLLSAGIGGVMGGRKNATDDIQAGKLIFNIDLNVDQQQLVSEYELKMLDLQQEYFSQLKATSDVQSFTDNTEVLEQLRKEQQETLKELLRKLNLGEDALQNGILQHINIHNTVKGYSSAGGNYFSSKGGFSGAAFGSNLNNQLEILASMEAMGGLTKADIEFFKWAMINAGELMIGRKNKTSLEDYFSIFVGFLMFNDASLMIKDAQSFIQSGLSADTSQDLHLYDLNGVFVPSSYLLQKTWEELSKTYTEINTMAKNRQGTKAVLHTYDGNYLTGDWPGTYELAASKTKLEMHFLAGFADLLDAISASLNNL